jgi:hypothetical protein
MIQSKKSKIHPKNLRKSASSAVKKGFKKSAEIRVIRVICG